MALRPQIVMGRCYGHIYLAKYDNISNMLAVDLVSEIPVLRILVNYNIAIVLNTCKDASAAIEKFGKHFFRLIFSHGKLSRISRFQ
jgi:hypothetical protein